MARVSREEYLDAAEALFAERGFYGVSIAAIAEQLGLTKQALLHHFKSKAQLYGDVLHRISTQYDSFTVTSTDTVDPAAAAICAWVSVQDRSCPFTVAAAPASPESD